MSLGSPFLLLSMRMSVNIFVHCGAAPATQFSRSFAVSDLPQSWPFPVE